METIFSNYFYLKLCPLAPEKPAVALRDSCKKILQLEFSSTGVNLNIIHLCTLCDNVQYCIDNVQYLIKIILNSACEE